MYWAVMRTKYTCSGVALIFVFLLSSRVFYRPMTCTPYPLIPRLFPWVVAVAAVAVVAVVRSQVYAHGAGQRITSLEIGGVFIRWGAFRGGKQRPNATSLQDPLGVRPCFQPRW